MSTDDDRTWGGLGVFEYSRKGLPHALVHAPELVETGGHHGAFCSSVSEVSHKVNLKRAAQFAKTVSSKNESQENMLGWVQRHEIYDAIQAVHNASESVTNSNSSRSSSAHEEVERRYNLRTPLLYCNNWQELDHRGNSFPARWYSTFLSRDVTITREELLHLLATKLEISPSRSNLEKIRKHLFVRCYGAITINFPQEGISRRITGYSPTTHGRRDFVELSGTESGTALAAQVRIHDHTHVYKMFVYVHICTYTNTHDVRFTVLVYVLACTYTKCLYTRP